MLSSRAMSATLLVKNLDAIGLFEEERREIRGGWIAIEGPAIRAVGSGEPPPEVARADETIDGRGLVAIPGLVNTHHHLYQTLTRAWLPAANCSLFPWLEALYPIWSRLDDEAVRLGCLVGMAELLLSGCTTVADHHYIYPERAKGGLEAEVQAAREIGIRLHATRGSMSLSKKDGGLPPEAVVEAHDDILAACERAVRAHHDPARFAMCRVGLAPCSPFSVTPELMRDTAAMASRLGVTLHTHLSENAEDVAYSQARYGKRPVALLEELGWLGGSTWIAHGIHFDDGEVARLGRARVGVAHCPSSNMRLGSGIARVQALRAAGSPVGLGVDGSASNDASNMIQECRQALLLTRVAHGAGAITIDDVFRIASAGGAACLRRDDIGRLAPGCAADIALFPTGGLERSGAHDPLAALLLTSTTRADTVIVNGNARVRRGEIVGLDVERLVAQHGAAARRLVGA
jgi:8-oxoguanine deaminase